eukprot:8477295-Pyramimonas_sp.AAC.1
MNAEKRIALKSCRSSIRTRMDAVSNEGTMSAWGGVDGRRRAEDGWLSAEMGDLVFSLVRSLRCAACPSTSY